MSENNISWFHCGRCGSLFQSSIGNAVDRTCSECGRNPSLVLEPPSAPPAVSKNPEAAPLQENPGRPPERSKHSVRKRKGSYFMFVLVAGWVLFIGLIIVGARYIWPEKKDSGKVAYGKTVIADQVTDAEIDQLNEAAPYCTATLSGFLSAGAPEERNQFVLDPINTAARMARFYELNPIVNIDAGSLVYSRAALLPIPGLHAIETQWLAADNRHFDAVFVEKNGEWRLDWDHFARYGDYPWALFLAGSGPAEGEFRLLARERLAKERKNEDSISIVLYAPRFGYSGESGYQSPEFLIKRNTPDGRLLDAAFEQQRKGERAFGVKLKSINPDGFIRLRVKVRRVDKEDGRAFELEKVVASHWYSTDEPGVKTADTSEKK